MALVYKLTNPLNGKSYIGSTTDMANRKSIHLAVMRKNSQLPMYRDMRETGGYDSFHFEILATFVVEDQEDRDILHTAEQSYIEKYDTIANGYNTRKAIATNRDDARKWPSTNPKKMCESCNCTVFIKYFATHCTTTKHIKNVKTSEALPIE